MKKVLSLILAIAMVLAVAAFAESGTDLQSELDAANARIAELEALVEKYEPYFTKNIVASFGDNVVMLDEVLADFEEMNAMYKQFGIDLAAYGMEGQVKKDIADSHVADAVMLAKAAELGLDQLDEAALASMDEEFEATLASYITSYTDYFYPDQEVTEEMTNEAKEYWAQNGLDHDSYIAGQMNTAVLDAVHDYLTKDVSVSEEDIEAAYNALVEENKESYADPSAFVNDHMNDATVAWVPEGVRAVKQILIKFDDDQSNRYSEINAQLASLNAEKEAAAAPAEETEDAEADEETEAPRSIEEIDADIAACEADMEALYAEIMPEVNEVVEAFNAGTPIEELIEKYNDDPGMKNEPTATEGYYVCDNCTVWDPAFTGAAMSIANIGEMAEPARGSYGVYIIYYLDDVPAGEVGLDAIHDALSETALEEKTTEAYESQVDEWVKEAAVTYYYENLGLSAEEIAAMTEA